MRYRFSQLPTLACLVLLAGCSEPFIVMAGDALSGQVLDPPADWSPIEKVDTFQLETRPGDPYSVNVWAVGLGPDVYVATRKDGTRWSEHMTRDRRVRLRAGTTLYDLEATIVLEPSERKRVADAYVSKYDIEADDSWVLAGLIFRLDRP